MTNEEYQKKLEKLRTKWKANPKLRKKIEQQVADLKEKFEIKNSAESKKKLTIPEIQARLLQMAEMKRADTSF